MHVLVGIVYKQKDLKVVLESKQIAMEIKHYLSKYQ